MMNKWPPPTENTATDAPWYVRAAYTFGVPTIIAGFLIWAMATRVDSGLTHVDASLTQLTDELNQHQKDMGYSIMQQEAIKSLMQQICVNTAKNVPDRTACFLR